MKQNKPKLLYIDDSNACLDSAKHVFKGRINAEINTISDIDEATDYIIDNASDLIAILLDIKMPGINGLDFLACLRKEYSKESLPVILITGYPFSREETDMAFSLGATDIFTKDFDLQSKEFAILVNRLNHYVNVILEKRVETVNRQKLKDALMKARL